MGNDARIRELLSTIMHDAGQDVVWPEDIAELAGLIVPLLDERGETLTTPRGYDGVEHDDGTVHAIDLDELHDDRPLWRETPVCGRATGVSSDEGGRAALHRGFLTCTDCIAILA